ADELRRHVLRQLALAARALGIVVEVVAELRADDEIAMFFENRREDRLPAPVSVRISGVDVVDTEVDRATDEVLGLRVGVVSPPACGDCPRSKPEFGYFEVCSV